MAMLLCGRMPSSASCPATTAITASPQPAANHAVVANRIFLMIADPGATGKACSPIRHVRTNTAILFSLPLRRVAA